MPPKTKTWFTAFNKNPSENLKKMSVLEIANVMQQLQVAYHNTAKPLVSDDIYDIIKEKLEVLDPTNPILFNVGAAISATNVRKVKLPVYMGSMDKVKADTKAIDAFATKYGQPSEYVITDKLDGNSALYVVDSAGKAKLYSRGNGEIGQDISHLVPFVAGFPKKPVGPMTVRGELIISRENWSKGIKGANARNTVAGIVNAKVPDLEIAALTSFVSYAVVTPEMSVSKQMTWLKTKKFTPVESIVTKTLDVTWLSEYLAKRRTTSPYEIDGVIVAHNAYYPVIAKKNPASAFAFKHLLTKETAEVSVTEVEWNVSKDGLLKPTVLFLPVQLSGVTIQRATGFNGDFIRSNVIGPGARLVITRSGDVIPHIIESLKPASSGKPQMPDVPFVWTEGGKEIKTKGNTSEQDLKQITHFFDKLKIKGFSEGTITKLYKAGYKTVKSVIDIGDDGGGIVRGPIVEAIRTTVKGASCVDLMVASNMFGMGFGERKLVAITNAIPGLTKNATPSVAELVAVDGVSTLTAGKFLVGLKQYRDFLVASGLGSSCVKVAAAAAVPKGTKWANQIVVFTGFRNKDWEQVITDNGGTIGASISSKTTLVVAKDPDASSGKLDGARAKGINIVGMDDFNPNP